MRGSQLVEAKLRNSTWSQAVLEQLHKSFLRFFFFFFFFLQPSPPPVNPAGLFSSFICCLRVHRVGPLLLNKAARASLSLNRSPWKFLVFLLSIFCSVSRALAAFFFFFSPPLWSTVERSRRAGTHEQLSRDPPPAALRWSASVDPFTRRAAAVGGLSPLKSRRQSMVTVSKVWGERWREGDGVEPGGAAGLLLWVQREVPNSCGSQGRFRGSAGAVSKEGVLGSHGNSIWPQKPSCCISPDFHIFERNTYCLDFITGGTQF